MCRPGSFGVFEGYINVWLPPKQTPVVQFVAETTRIVANSSRDPEIPEILTVKMDDEEMEEETLTYLMVNFTNGFDGKLQQDQRRHGRQILTYTHLAVFQYHYQHFSKLLMSEKSRVNISIECTGHTHVLAETHGNPSTN
ncbi:hypothetical protein BJ165DRAFT_1399980 [Panaeolus papilionaceus]|nr:hypothetical protein BJ165DRAFT_1399980 [Panaeolus papilionaceus]